MPLAFAATQDMYVIALVRTFKYSSYQKVVCMKGCPTNRATPFHFSVNTKRAAFNVHEAVFPPGYGRIGIGLNQFAFIQFHRTKGACLGIVRSGFSVTQPLFLVFSNVVFSAGYAKSCPLSDKQIETEP